MRQFAASLWEVESKENGQKRVDQRVAEGKVTVVKIERAGLLVLDELPSKLQHRKKGDSEKEGAHLDCRKDPAKFTSLEYADRTAGASTSEVRASVIVIAAQIQQYEHK
jgi:hypothetical protein